MKDVITVASRLTLIFVAATLYGQTNPTNFTSPNKIDWATAAVDAAPQPTDAEAQAVRALRDAMFNDSTGTKKPLDAAEADDSLAGSGMSIYHVKIPALPFAMSDSVILGRVVGFQPYFSSDHTALYTELIIAVDKILKGDSVTPSVGQTLVVPRLGGALRLRSGRILKQFVPRQEQMLEHGGEYVLFLSFDKSRRWFGLINTWDIRASVAIPVSPIDIADATRGISVYDGMPKAQFIQDLKDVASAEAGSKTN